MKKTWLVIFCLLLLGVSAPAQGQFTYTNSHGTLVITGYSGPGGAVNIPATINDLKVTSIGDYAFAGTDLSSIGIPDSVTNIGDGAFNYCTNLASITVPGSVVKFGEGVFNSCSRLASATLEDGIVDIGTNEFQDCASLVYISIPNSVTKIDDNAFYSCSSLTNIVISSRVVSIGGYAFSECINLTSIDIPSGVTKIGEFCFDGCTNLGAIIVSSNNPSYASEAGVLFNHKKTTLVGYPQGKPGASYTIPSTVSSIGDYGFYSCAQLANVAIPDSVTSIGKSAFGFCTNLSTITIPGKVARIGEAAFNDCSQLETVTLENGIKDIGMNAFQDCISLTNVSIPGSVTNIEDGAFNDCANLSNMAIPGKVARIGEAAFYDCTRLAVLTLEDGIKDIGTNAFQDCISLTNLSIPGSVASIGDSAFEGCSGLTSVAIPNGVVSIGSLAFSETSLTNVTIPASLTNMAGSPFAYCPGLAAIVVDSNSRAYTNVGGVLFNRSQTVLVGFPEGYAAVSYVIPNSVASIGPWAFGGCSGLTNVSIPDTVTGIGYGAFAGCSGLTSVYIPDSVTAVGWGAFEDCTSLSSVSIGNGVEIIADATFEDCGSLTNVTIGSGVQFLDPDAFLECFNLRYVLFEGNAPRIGPGIYEPHWDEELTFYYLAGASGWDSSYYDYYYYYYGIRIQMLTAHGQIEVTLLPSSANGRWRFPWETTWRNSGTAASNLNAGEYPIVFSTVPGYLTPTLPSPGYVAVIGGTTFVTNQYSPATSSSNVNNVGALTVNFVQSPPAEAAWGVAGGPAPSFTSGYRVNLAAGKYLIDFASVPGYATPAAISVLVVPDYPAVLSVSYAPVIPLSNLPSSFTSLPVQVPPSEISTSPFEFNGQLQTDVGYGSGVAVEANVVLTAADLVFNDQTLSYASQATWFPQQETGVTPPYPMTARGWYVLSGYASNRINDLQDGLAPGQSSPASRNSDVAALFFTSPVAGGNSASYLFSDGTPNVWLTSPTNKMMVGYPVDGSQFGVINITNGEMYENSPQTNALNWATDEPLAYDQVYLGDWFLGYQGNAGSPFYVESNGVFCPAGVYLGTVSDGLLPYASAVRAIDSTVVELIDYAAEAGEGRIIANDANGLDMPATGGDGNGRRDSPAGGTTPLEITPSTVSANNPGYVQIQLQPASAVLAGAGWRIHGESSYHSSDAVKQVNSSNIVAIQFAPVSGYSPPRHSDRHRGAESGFDLRWGLHFD